MTYRFLGNPECAHAEILSLFQDGALRPLYRVDDTKDGKIVYMVSKDIPDTRRWNSRFCDQRDRELCKVADYERFLDSISEGDVLSFRIKAVPTKSRDGKKMSLGHSEAFEWMRKKISENGATVIDGTLDQTGEEKVRFKKDPHQEAYVYFHTRTYEGILTVDDKEKFARMLSEGIGRQKAYGCGLMTVVPV